MRSLGCLVLASCVHAAPPPAPARDARALPSDAELATAPACERHTGELRRAIAQGDAQARDPWQSKLDANAVRMLADLDMAWDAVVPLYVRAAAPFDESQRAQLREACANIVVNAGALASIEAPLSCLACFGELDFVRQVAGHDRVHPT
jgi:hypothetical protein